MRSEMVAGLPSGASVVAGCAERLPVRAASIDIVWLSAVVHHLVDLDESAGELRRVLADDGVVLIRGLFADGVCSEGLQFLPGWERALASFPSTATVEAALTAVGFELLGRTEVADSGPSSVGASAEWIRLLRRADSFLGQLTDDEINDGLATLEGAIPDRTLDPATLTLLAFALP